MKTKLSLLVGLILCTSSNVQAAIVSGYGVQANAGSASNCPSFCTTAGGGDFQSETNGDEFVTSASASDDTYGSATASASYTGASPSFLPTLRVDTSSGFGKRASANAFGVQGYSYSGNDRQVTLNFNLHGSVGDSSFGYVFNNLNADVAVIAGSQLEWFPDFGTLVFEVAGGLDVVGNESVFITSPGANQNAPGSITFDLTDGMDFYVVASMRAIAQNGFASALNTFSMSFDDDTGLTAASTASAVPVPAAAWLFGSGLIGLAGFARCKKNI